MSRRTRQARSEITHLLGSRPGWRLEPQTTPGASPLWCYVVDGEIEFSVTAESGGISLYSMADDRQHHFDDADELTAWLSLHRADALRDAPDGPEGKSKIHGLFRWS
jgi:hypothetical protein